jgi:long-chain fatty acid transport protein
VNATSAARRPALLSLTLCSAAVLIAGLPLRTSATDGPAFSGLIASANDAVTAATNPAGLTRLHEAEWVGGVRAFYIASDFTTTAQSVGGSLTNSSSSSLAIPSLYYARPFDDDITLGISLTVPSGFGSNPGDATPGRYLLEKWSLGYASLTPAAGYRVSEQLSFGAGVNFNYAVYDYQTAVFNGVGQPDGMMKLHASDFGLGFQLGTLYELTPMTRFGVAYTSSSSSKFSSTPELSGLTSQREALLPLGIRDKPVTLRSKFPTRVVAGAWHEFDDGKSATLDVAWVNFSQFGLSSATVGSTSIAGSDKHYNNIWGASAGANWPLDEEWTLRFGAVYASSGVDTENRSFSFRLDRVVGAGVGAEYRWGKARVVGANVTYYDLGSAPVNANIPLVGTLSGHYTTNYAIGLDLTLRWIR